VVGERAFNHYIDALGTWEKCIEDFGCEIDSVEPDLQAQWAKAAVQIQKAETGLEELAIPQTTTTGTDSTEAVDIAPGPDDTVLDRPPGYDACTQMGPSSDECEQQRTIECLQAGGEWDSFRNQCRFEDES
jgi:hypothetical protein